MGVVKKKNAMNWFNNLGKASALFLLLAGMTGCDRISPDDRAFFEARDKERASREHLLRAANAAVASDDVVRSVRQSPAPEGPGTVDNWLDEQGRLLKGQVMFPRWITNRRGSNKQEVTYEFVLIDAQNQMRKLNFTWDIDVLDMTIGSPRFSQVEEIDSPDRTLAQKTIRRIREHERHLE